MKYPEKYLCLVNSIRTINENAANYLVSEQLISDCRHSPLMELNFDTSHIDEVMDDIGRPESKQRIVNLPPFVASFDALC